MLDRNNVGTSESFLGCPNIFTVQHIYSCGIPPFFFCLLCMRRDVDHLTTSTFVLVNVPTRHVIFQVFLYGVCARRCAVRCLHLQHLRFWFGYVLCGCSFKLFSFLRPKFEIFFVFFLGCVHGGLTNPRVRTLRVRKGHRVCTGRVYKNTVSIK